MQMSLTEHLVRSEPNNDLLRVPSGVPTKETKSRRDARALHELEPLTYLSMQSRRSLLGDHRRPKRGTGGRCRMGGGRWLSCHGVDGSEFTMNR